MAQEPPRSPSKTALSRSVCLLPPGPLHSHAAPGRVSQPTMEDKQLPSVFEDRGKGRPRLLAEELYALDSEF